RPASSIDWAYSSPKADSGHVINALGDDIEPARGFSGFVDLKNEAGQGSFDAGFLVYEQLRLDGNEPVTARQALQPGMESLDLAGLFPFQHVPRHHRQQTAARLEEGVCMPHMGHALALAEGRVHQDAIVRARMLQKVSLLHPVSLLPQ